MIAFNVDPLKPTTANVISWGANYGPLTIAGHQWWRLLTSMFLHIGILHLTFNMYVLWKAGPFVERLLGNTGFVVVYLASGLAGGIASLVWNPYLASAGASGAIFGLYGAMLGFVYRADIPVELLEPLIKSALIFLGYNLIFGLINTGTDLAAHIGGLVGGLLCGVAASVPLTGERMPQRSARNIGIAIGALVLLAGAVVLLPRPFDLQAQLHELGGVEKKVLGAYNAATIQLRAKKLTAAQMADAIDKQVLPPWIAERGKLAALKGLPERQQHLITRVLAYMDARQQAWTLLSYGLRNNDMNSVRASMAKQGEVQRLMKDLAAPAH